MRDKYQKIIFTLILIFTFTGCYQIVQPVKQHKYSPLHTAVRMGQLDSVKLLINSSNLNIIDSYGDTPLIDAVRNNSIQISKILICHGADLNVTDANNYTLLDMALRNNNNEMIKILTSPTDNLICHNKIKKEISLPIQIATTTEASTKQVTEIKKPIETPEKEIIQEEKETISHNEDNNDTEIIKETIIDETLTVEELNAYIDDDKDIKEIDLDEEYKEKSKKEIKDDNLNKNTLIEKLFLISLDNEISFNSKELTFVFSTSSDLTNSFKNRLAAFIPQLLDAINKHKNSIKEIKIKSYTSSEFRSQSTVIGKFMANKRIAQRRSAEINTYISKISSMFDLDTRWIEKYFVSYGMGSTNVIRDEDGNENTIKSRRTEFEIILN